MNGKTAPGLRGLWACTLASSLFAVALQFFKGEVLDRAIAGEGAAALGYGLALGCFILGEVGFFYLYRRLGDRFAAGCVTALKRDVFESALRLGAAAQLITTLMSYLSYFIVLACSAWLVLRGDFSAGDFFVAIGMIDQLSYPIISLAGIVRELSAIRPACREMERFIGEPSPSGADGTAPRLRREICFRGVRFGYEGRGTVLDGFSLTLKKGGRYLLKGPSGCGKTTAVNLLLSVRDRTVLVVSHQFSQPKLGAFDEVVDMAAGG